MEEHIRGAEPLGIYRDVQRRPDRLGGASIAKRVQKAGLSSERPFHTLRHSFGSYLAMSGVNLYDIAKLMGHTLEQVTQLYAHLPKPAKSGSSGEEIAHVPRFGRRR